MLSSTSAADSRRLAFTTSFCLLLRDLRAEVIPAKEKVLIFVGNPVSIIQGTLLKPLEEKLVKVAPWKEIDVKGPEIVRLEPSGLTVAGIEHAINYSQRTWWLKIANFTEHYVFIDRNDVIAYVEEGEVEGVGGSCAEADYGS